MTHQKHRIIALEEHYWDPALTAHFVKRAGRPDATQEKLYELGAKRLQDMDAAGIDVQVLSHGAPSTQTLGIDIAARLATTSTTASRRSAPPTRSASARWPRCRRSIRQPRRTNSSARCMSTASRAR